MLLLGFLFFPLFFIFLAPLFFFLLLGAAVGGRRRGGWHCGPGGEYSGSALDTLEIRYAEGEIDRAEYLARKKDLTPEVD